MRFFPIIFFLLIAVLLATLTNLSESPKFYPNMIGKTLPYFESEDLMTGKKVTSKELNKEILILNVWASWCIGCQAEHATLLEMQKMNLPLYGIDSGDDAKAGQQYLEKMHNPFKQVLYDPKREVAIAIGTTGMPETFVVGKDGVIYYHYRGNLTPDILKNKLMPIYDELLKK